jgi:hypothetical protein
VLALSLEETAARERKRRLALALFVVTWSGLGVQPMSVQDITIARTTSSRECSQGSLYENMQVRSDTNNAVDVWRPSVGPPR